MLIARIGGATRVCGVQQGYMGLPLRDELDDGMHVMVTAWEPTPEELELLAAGAKVQIHIGGTVPPPMKVTVGAKP